MFIIIMNLEAYHITKLNMNDDTVYHNIIDKNVNHNIILYIHNMDKCPNTKEEERQQQHSSHIVLDHIRLFQHREAFIEATDWYNI